MKHFLLAFTFLLFVANQSYGQYTITKFSDPSIVREARGFAVAPDSIIYFYNNRDEIYRIEGNTVAEISHDCPSFCRVGAITLDQEGRLLVASQRGGLVRVSADSSEQLLAQDATSVAVGTDGSIYVGTSTNSDDSKIGIFRNGTWETYDKNTVGINSNIINDIEVADNGDVWFASFSGLIKFDGETFTNFTTPALSESFGSMDIDTEGNIWVNSAFGGLGKFDGTTWTTFPDLFTPFTSLSSVKVGTDGSVWSSDSDGIYHLFDDKLTVIPYEDLGLGNGFIVRGMTIDNANRLWVSLDFSRELAIISFAVPAFNVRTTVQNICPELGGSITVTPEEDGDFTYEWSNGATEPQLTNLTAAGDYTVTVTDANGGSVIQTFRLTRGADLDMSIVADSVICPGATDFVRVLIDDELLFNEAENFVWNTGDDGAFLFSVPPGAYTVTYTNPIDQCPFTRSFAIAMADTLEVNVQTMAASAENSDGTVTLEVSGGTPPYQYFWDTDSTATGATLENLPAGDYSATVVDALLCRKEVTFGINSIISSLPELDILSDFHISPNPNDGLFQVNLTFKEPIAGQIEIINLQGHRLFTRTFDKVAQYTLPVDVSHLTNGLYLLKVQSEKGLSTKRFTLVK